MRTRQTALFPVIAAAVVATAVSLGLSACTQQSIDQTRTTMTTPVLPGGIAPKGNVIGTNSIADIAEAASKSVVNIDTSTSVTLPDTGFHFGLPLHQYEMFFGPMQQRPRTFETHGTGSGVIIREDGYVLTNNHVVGKADKIKVTLDNKRSFTGRVIGRDSFTDLALVKIDASGLPVARLGSAKTLRPGDWAIAIGSPVGLDNTVTLGIVSALGRSLDSRGIHSDIGLIQTDAAINPGNSGGPLLNIQGEVIGLNTAIRADAQNIGFAIPVDVAKTVTQQLLEKGSISRPYVGIYMRSMDAQVAETLSLPPDTKGVVVAQVAPGGPADDAGLRAGDIITAIDGKAVNTSTEVQAIVRAKKPGDRLTVTLNRRGRPVEQLIQIGDYPVTDRP